MHAWKAVPGRTGICLKQSRESSSTKYNHGVHKCIPWGCELILECECVYGRSEILSPRRLLEPRIRRARAIIASVCQGSDEGSDAVWRLQLDEHISAKVGNPSTNSTSQEHQAGGKVDRCV